MYKCFNFSTFFWLLSFSILILVVLVEARWYLTAVSICISLMMIYVEHLFVFLLATFRASLVAQLAKNLPAMQKNRVWSLGQEDPLEKGIATHSRILVWRIPWTTKEATGGITPWWATSMGSQRVRHDWATNTYYSFFEVMSVQVFCSTYVIFWLHWIFDEVCRGLYCGVWAFSSCGVWAYLPHSMWDLSSLTSDGTCIPCSGKQILDHWTPRKIPVCFF